MSLFDSAPNLAKLKTNLSLICNRLKLLQKKKTEISEKARAEIANFLKENKIERARIRCEYIVREDYLVEVYDSLEMFCEILLTRFGLIQSQKEVDKGLEEIVATIIWSAPRLQFEIPEFKEVTEQFTRKYGKNYVAECLADTHLKVKRDMMKKLKVEAIPSNLIEMYLVEIAKCYNVPFEPDPKKINEEFSNNLISICDDLDTQFIPNDIGFNASKIVPSSSTYQDNSILFPYPPNTFELDTKEKPFNFQSEKKLPFNELTPTVPPPAYGENNSVSGIVANQMNLPGLPNVPSNTNSNDDRNSTTRASAPPDDDNEIDFDDLSKRFEQLKKE